MFNGFNPNQKYKYKKSEVEKILKSKVVKSLFQSERNEELKSGCKPINHDNGKLINFYKPKSTLQGSTLNKIYSAGSSPKPSKYRVTSYSKCNAL